jgi:hypothetical protein
MAAFLKPYILHGPGNFGDKKLPAENETKNT